jgi:hypothetical protein
MRPTSSVRSGLRHPLRSPAEVDDVVKVALDLPTSAAFLSEPAETRLA